MKFLGLDFETQDDQARTTRVTEVGAILYEYLGKQEWIGDEFTCLREIRRYEEFCWEPDYPPQTPKIIDLTGITDEMLREQGITRNRAMKELTEIVAEADVIFAHKISFDKVVYESTCKLFDIVPPEKEWVCTLTNFPWPKRLTCKKLSHLAYEHGLMVDPRTLHRAVNDVELMMRLLSGHYNFEQILAYARAPWIYMKADILGPWIGKGGDGGTQNGFVKELGFSYEQVRGVEEHKWPKKWVHRVKTEPEFEALVEAGATFKSPFRVSRIEGLT